MQVQTPEVTGQNRSLSVNGLYNNYAAMLLGYIFEAVKNRAIAEQYLIAVFNDVPNELDEFTKPGVNAFCRLQQMARKKLVPFFEAGDGCVQENTLQKGTATGNKYTAQMNHEQQLVFCGLHWQGKTIARVATELNKPEEAVKKILKECFTIIRNSSK